MVDTVSIRTIKDRIKKGLPLIGAFAVGSLTTLVYIRYRNGIGFNEVIWSIPVENLRKAVEPGSKFILNTPNHGEMFITKMPRTSSVLKFTA